MGLPGAAHGYTSEIKFVVSDAVGVRIRDWARDRLDADPNGGGAHADEYRVSTIYLDTPGRDVFHRRGSYGRSKYRVRRYGDESRVFLERKLRTASRLAKRRTDIALDKLPAVTQSASKADPTWWFQRRIQMRQLEPLCRVSYLRTARATDGDGGPARLTLDQQLTALPVDLLTFADEPGRSLLDGTMILELKFRGPMPAVFRQLADTFALTPGRASKYRVAADSLGLAGTGPNEGAPYSLHA
jgi:hypothetical protein